MSISESRLSRLLSGADGAPAYLADLSLWHQWHRRQDTLPERWRDLGLPGIAAALGTPAWVSVRPWHVEMAGIQVHTQEGDEERVTTWQTPAGPLVSRWALGPDGDWWQTAYPITHAHQLDAGIELVQAMEYRVDGARLAKAVDATGPDGIVAIELPRRPYSDLLHDYLGWSEGLMLMFERPEIINEMIDVLEEKLHDLVLDLAELPGELVLSPDNLDGQFVSPRAFDQYLGPSYEDTAEILHDEGKLLWVHVGGPVSRLLASLADAGVDGVQGVCGPPQGDTTLGQALAIAGTDITLWGGIPQDILLASQGEEQLEAAVAEAVRDARAGGCIILGVADRVPVDAELSRLEALPELIRQMAAG